MDNSLITQVLNQKIKVFIFFAFVLFGGLAALFLYYKTLGGIGFAMSTGFFELWSGGVNLILVLTAMGLAFLMKQRKIEFNRPLMAIISLLILGFAFNQLIIWLVKYNEGLFIGGNVLKTLTVDDMLYFTFYYFITSFQLIFSTIVGVSYLIISIKGEHTNLNGSSLYKLMQPILFSVCCVFIFYHLWN